MRLKRRKYKRMKKKIADLENIIQSQQEEIRGIKVILNKAGFNFH